MLVYYMMPIDDHLIIGTNKAKVLKHAKQLEKDGIFFEDGLHVESFSRNVCGIGAAIYFGVMLGGGEPGNVEWLI